VFPRNQHSLKPFTHWQNAFIRDNFPVIGYHAWTGFQSAGWGLLACQAEPLPAGAEHSLHIWRFTAQFVPGRSLADYLRLLDIPPPEIPALVDAIAQYNPEKEITLLIRSGKSVEVNWLKNLATTPPKCYLQVCDRWDEFMPDVPQ
jgi:hypothetical protein